MFSQLLIRCVCALYFNTLLFMNSVSCTTKEVDKNSENLLCALMRLLSKLKFYCLLPFESHDIECEDCCYLIKEKNLQEFSENFPRKDVKCMYIKDLFTRFLHLHFKYFSFTIWKKFVLSAFNICLKAPTWRKKRKI